MKLFIVWFLTLIGFLFLFIIVNLQEKIIIDEIISGQPASLGQFPWQVIFQDPDNIKYICGGSLISKKWVLSSAHCFEESRSNSLKVTLGKINIINNKMVSRVTRNIRKIIIHHCYNNATFENDIALIELNSPITVSHDIKPVDLIMRELTNAPFIGAPVIVTGFGYINDEDLIYSEKLLYTQMIIRSNDYCIKEYDNGDKYFKKSTICASPQPGTNQNICKGDSGGAMIILLYGIPYQIGINSFIYKRFHCTDGKPSGFQRVGNYYKFIDDNITD